MVEKLSEETLELIDAIMHELMAPGFRAAEEAVRKMLKEDYGIDWDEVEKEQDKVDEGVEVDEDETDTLVADAVFPDVQGFGPEN